MFYFYFFSAAHFNIEVPPDALETAYLEITVNEEEITMCEEMAQCPEDAKISNFVNVYPYVSAVLPIPL